MNQNPLDQEDSSQAPGSPPPASEDANSDGLAKLSTKAQGENLGTAGFEGNKNRSIGKRWPKIEGYEIQGILGEGGMGVVYRARNVNLNRAVAIKMILSGSNANTQSLERFANEIKSISRLQHRSIIQILDAGTCQDQPFFVMEFVEGQTLAKRTEERPFSFREAAELTEQLALAMEYAHQQGVIHRDLKPTNILLTPDGVPKIMDFGIAKRSDFARDLTATGVILGTPGYLSPEQAEGRSGSIGPGSDVFALGVMLYEMLAGQRPFDALSEVEVMKKIIHDDPPSPAWYRPSIPGDLETICLKCLNKTPAKRYLSAAELAADLRRYLDGQVILARPATLFEKCNKGIRRNPVRFAGAATVGLLIIAAVGGLFWDNRQRSQSLARTKRLAGYGSEFSMWVIRHHMVKLDDVNGSTDLKLRLSGKVQRFLDATSQLTEVDSEFNHRMGVAYQNLAELQGNPFANNLGQVNESIANYRRGLALLEKTERQSPVDLESLYDSASCSIELANLFSQSSALDQAGTQLENAARKISIIERENKSPGVPISSDRLVELNIKSNVARCYIAREKQDVESGVSLLDELDRQINQFSDDPAYSETREFYFTWLAGAKGYLCRLRGDSENAIVHLMEQRRLTQVKFDREPDSLYSKNHLAVANTYLGEILIENEDFAAAIEYLDLSAALYREILLVDSQNVLAKENLCDDLRLLARAHIELDEFRAAASAILESVVLRREIAAADPDAITHQQNLASTIRMSAFINSELGNADAFFQNTRELIELARSIKTADPKQLDYKTLFVNSCLFVARNITDDALQLNSAGQADEKTKLLAEAERLVREALATLDETGRQEKPNDASETLREELIEVLKDIERVKSANE